MRLIFKIILPVAVVGLLLPAAWCVADGKVMAKEHYARKYKGSIEERAQEAIIIFRAGDEEEGRPAREDLILKIQVEGEALQEFAWIIPFPSKPVVKKEDAVLFRELFDYVEERLSELRYRKGKYDGYKSAEKKGESVKVLSREIVGSYDVAVVSEREQGALNNWLAENGYQQFEGIAAEKLIEEYRRKNYVFACIKVKELNGGSVADIHPLRFTFDPKNYEKMYYPMRITGLQEDPVNINLYIFHRYWINFNDDKDGVVRRGFRLYYRDWDSPACEANAGKNYAAPGEDPFLEPYARDLPNVARLFRKLHPDENFYLTNLKLGNANPADLLEWDDELWIGTHRVGFFVNTENWWQWVVGVLAVVGLGFIVFVVVKRRLAKTFH